MKLCELLTVPCAGREAGGAHADRERQVVFLEM